MNQMKVEKEFDCLKLKLQVQEQIAEEIKDLTPKEQIEYFLQKAESSSLGSWWKSIKSKPKLAEPIFLNF